MTYLGILGAIFSSLVYLIWRLWVKPHMPSTDNLTEITLEPPKLPPDETLPSVLPKPEITPIPYLWNTPEKARKTVELMCQERGYTPYEISLICAVIMAESEFKNSATNQNYNEKGEVTSIDVGICQINNRFHIGKGLDFPSTEYVVANPEKAVEWMLDRFEEGHITWWSAYQNGSYKKYLG